MVSRDCEGCVCERREVTVCLLPGLTYPGRIGSLGYVTDSSQFGSSQPVSISSLATTSVRLIPKRERLVVSEEEKEFLEKMRDERLWMDEVLRKAFGPDLEPDPYDHAAYMRVVTKALRERVRVERPADPSASYGGSVWDGFAAGLKQHEHNMADVCRRLMERENPLVEVFLKRRQEDAARRASESAVDRPQAD